MAEVWTRGVTVGSHEIASAIITGDQYGRLHDLRTGYGTGTAHAMASRHGMGTTGVRRLHWTMVLRRP